MRRCGGIYVLKFKLGFPSLNPEPRTPPPTRSVLFPAPITRNFYVCAFGKQPAEIATP
jgi:hypothetical protein